MEKSLKKEKEEEVKKNPAHKENGIMKYSRKISANTNLDRKYSTVFSISTLKNEMGEDRVIWCRGTWHERGWNLQLGEKEGNN